jgi:hypothetical protein
VIHGRIWNPPLRGACGVSGGYGIRPYGVRVVFRADMESAPTGMHGVFRADIESAPTGYAWVFRADIESAPTGMRGGNLRADAKNPPYNVRGIN